MLLLSGLGFCVRGERCLGEAFAGVECRCRDVPAGCQEGAPPLSQRLGP